MIKITVTSNAEKILLSLPQKAVIKESIMDEIASGVQNQIKFKISNASSFFAPNKKGTRLLYKSGTLYESIKRITSLGTARVFTDLFYSNYLNDGTEKMIPRPFFLEKNKEVPQDLKDIAYNILANKSATEIFEGFDELK